MVQTSYDIIKTYGGELKVETKEGEFEEFLIFLIYLPSVQYCNARKVK